MTARQTRRDGKTEAGAAELITGKTFRAMRYRGHTAIWKVGPSPRVGGQRERGRGLLFWAVP